MNIRPDFSVVLSDLEVVGTLSELQQAFVMYRDMNGLGASEMGAHDGLVKRGEHKVGHFSYNGRFWRTGIKGNRLTIWG